MRFLCDENFPTKAVARLRESKHDVAWIAELRAGADDETVLRLTADERRILLTFDRDFGRLHATWPGVPGIVYFRLPDELHRRFAELIESALNSRADWEGHFSVVEVGRIRMRPLTATPHPGRDPP